MDLQAKSREELIDIVKQYDETFRQISRNSHQVVYTHIKEQSILNKLIELNPYAIAIWDHNGGFVKANPAYMKMFMGCPPPEYSLWDDPILHNCGFWEQFVKLKQGLTLKFPPICYNTHDLDPQFPDNLIWFKTVVFPIQDAEEQLEFLVFIYDDVTHEKALEEQSAQQQTIISETNITLRNLIARIEEEKNSIKENIALNLRNNCKPILMQLKSTNPELTNSIELLERKMDQMTSDFYKRLVLSKYHLTPSEIKICQMVRDGYSGKEIASLMNISYATVHNHKQHVREKLDLRKTKINLKSFLLDF